MSGRVTPFHRSLLLFLGGPVLWFSHFMLVYLVAEAACAAGGVRLLGLPLVTVVTVAATVLGVPATLLIARTAWRVWRREEDQLAVVAFLLALLSAAAILFDGVPPLVLPPC